MTGNYEQFLMDSGAYGLVPFLSPYLRKYCSGWAVACLPHPLVRILKKLDNENIDFLRYLSNIFRLIFDPDEILTSL